jgi:hypothetical protein
MLTAVRGGDSVDYTVRRLDEKDKTVTTISAHDLQPPDRSPTEWGQRGVAVVMP